MMGRTRSLLAGVSLCAIATLATPAAAQSFNGNPTVNAGSAGVATGAGTTTVSVQLPETVMTWLVTDPSPGTGSIVFQPAGTTATFTNNTGTPDFTILNRVITVDAAASPVADAIVFNGTVQALNGATANGNVWFYSPTGIVVGPSAKFNVGGLILTTDNIQFVAGVPVGALFGPGNLVTFRGPNSATGFVTIQPGASITATGTAGYVALVAPVVTQSGQVLADHSIAYVAGEELDLKINAGIFDISIVTGTDDTNGVVHTGVSGTAAIAGKEQPQRISLVALPKNTALTMLLGGTLGYVPAAVATDAGSAVVLSAGYTNDYPAVVPAAPVGNLFLNNSTYGYTTLGYATGDITILPKAGAVNFRNTALFAAGQSINATADLGAQILGTDLFLSAGTPGQGGTIDVVASAAGKITLTSSLTIDAGSDAGLIGLRTGKDGFGGTVNLTADNGGIAAPTLFVASFGAGQFDDLLGGTGQGGTVALKSQNGGTIATSNPLIVTADGRGGDSAVQGGTGIGGTATVDLADGAFAYGQTFVTAVGTGGDGNSLGGTGTGGTARFALVDDAAGPTGPRSVAELNVDASGVGGTDPSSVFGPSNAGSVTLTSNSNAAEPLLVTGNLNLTDQGATAAAGNGIAATVSTAQLTVGGNIVLDTSRDASVTANQPLHANGTVAVNARSLTETGSLESGGAMSVVGPNGITAAQLISGGTTLLQATNGPVTVNQLLSAGAVTALARSVSITSTGALTFAGAQATGGNLVISAAGGLTVPGASATGLISLTSSGGVVTSTAPVTAAGSFAASGNGGLNFGTVTSGGTTQLVSSNGPVVVTSLTSPGLVAAQGTSVTLTSPGALSFANLQATGGNASVTTANNLTLAQSSATGTLTLTSTGGAISASAPQSSGGAASYSAPGGITLFSLASGGTTSLISTAGAVSVPSLTSVGAVTARGTSVTLSSPGALSFANLQATAGNASATTAANMALSQGSATGTLTLASTGGALTATGPLSSGGAASLSGVNGITVPTVTSGGTTALVSTGGAVNVTSLTSAGAVTAQGTAVTLASPGALSFANLQATVGNASVSTAGNLALAQGSATGTLTLGSTGGAVTGTGPLSSGGTATLSAPGGIALAALTSGGTTSLISTGGAVSSTALTSAGAVTARGTAVTLVSPGSLSLADLLGSNGNADVMTAGALSVAQATASALLNLRSGTALTVTGPLAGNSVALTGTGSVTVNGSGVQATNALTVTTNGLFSANTLLLGRTITATSGDIALGAAAQLGALTRTTDLSLVNGDATAATRIGTGTGYVLSPAEMAQLFADNTISITASAQPFTVDTLTFDMTHLGTTGSLRLIAPGSLNVVGAARFNSVAAGQTVSLQGATVQVTTDTGSLAVVNGAGVQAGTLRLVGNTVSVASAAALADIAAMPSLTQISARLDQPSAGGGEPIRAGTLNVSAANAFYVQNTGTTIAYPDRRGFNADALNVTTGSAATRIAINGRVAGAVGLQVTPLIRINGAAAAAGGQFDPLSTVNGCVIGRGCAGGAFAPDPSIELTNPVPQNPGGSLPSPLVTLSPTDERGDRPLIDEPITGVGNDDLWESACKDGDSRQARCKEASDKP